MAPPLVLNVELGRLCPFSAPRGHTFSTCPPRFPPRVFHGQIFTPDKHKVSAPNAQKSDPNYSPLKKLKRLEKIDFQHTRVNYPVPVHHANTRPLGTKKLPVLYLEMLETSMMG